ncbi:MAG: hypothetical protein ABJB76_02690 [Candidatus Nitrosocosmicus sp.]
MYITYNNNANRTVIFYPHDLWNTNPNRFDLSLVFRDAIYSIKSLLQVAEKSSSKIAATIL